jgi:hypothetical protein
VGRDEGRLGFFGFSCCIWLIDDRCGLEFEGPLDSLGVDRFSGVGDREFVRSITARCTRGIEVTGVR